MSIGDDAADTLTASSSIAVNSIGTIVQNAEILGGTSLDYDAVGTIDINNPIAVTDTVAIDSYGVTTITDGSHITAGNDVTFGGDKTGMLKTTGDVNITTPGGAFGGVVTMNNEVLLGGNMSIDTTNADAAGANIAFKDKIDGDATGTRQLTLDAGTGGDVDFDDFVGSGDVDGGTERLGNVIITNARNVNIDRAFNAASLSQLAGSGTTTFGSTLQTTNAINLINTAFVFNNDITTTGGGAVTINGGATINDDITIDTGTASIWLMGTVAGGANKLTLNGGQVRIDNDITVTGGFSSTSSGGGAFIMADGALINAGAEPIDITADGNITLGGLLTTNDSALAVEITSGGSIFDGGNTDLEVDAPNGTLKMTASGSIGSSGNPLEIRVDTLDATANGIAFDEADDVTISVGSLNAGSGALTLYANNGAIDGGTISAGSVTIEANTFGINDPVTLDVGPNNITMDLDQQLAGVSAYIRPGGALSSTPTGITAVGAVIIEGIYTFLSGTLADVEGELASLSTLSAQQEQLEILLRAASEAAFFMTPPLDLYIEMEEEELPEFEEEAMLLNPGGLNARHWNGNKPTLLHDIKIENQMGLSYYPNWKPQQKPRIIASLTKVTG